MFQFLDSVLDTVLPAMLRHWPLELRRNANRRQIQQHLRMKRRTSLNSSG